MLDANFEIKLDNSSEVLWKKYLLNIDNLGHINRTKNVLSIDGYFSECLRSAFRTAFRIRSDIFPLKPVKVLEVGSSAGLLTFAIKAVFPEAEVYGIEPEIEAHMVAEELSRVYPDISPVFLSGVGENLPFHSNTFDLIICHTVIEHVANVDKVVSEMSRVLKLDGICHLDAPNYLFPYEPHLEIFTIPLFGKSFVAFTAFFQGKASCIGFLKHLNFVTPSSLQKSFTRHNLTWQDRAHRKIESTLNGDVNLKKYIFAGKVLSIAGQIGLSRLTYLLIAWLGIYPSLMYTLKKNIISSDDNA